MDYVKLREKGMLLLLNLEPDLNFNNMIRGRTLPTFILANTFLSWEDYLQSLRADYRRRINHFTVSFTEVVYKRIPCKDFDCQLYNLYLDVLGHSKGKLETLSLEFFQNLPDIFCLTAFYNKEQTIGWIITTKYHDKLSFFLGGLDYRKNRQFNTYFNLLAEVVKEGIEKKATLIDLGQTAEIPKMRMGGKPVGKTMMATHSNPVIRQLLKSAKGWLEYSPTMKEVHVFKKTV